MSKNVNEVRVEKTINKPAKTVFQALAEGRLFNNCGAAQDKLEIDFRTGGQYTLSFSNGQMKLCGKFTEIVPDKKIGFTWGDKGSDDGLPFSQVSIELFGEGDKTRVLILHTGFKTQEEVESHKGGWTSGLNDLSEELVEGRIRLVRTYPVNRDTLYKTCSDMRKFLGCVSTDAAGGELDFRVGGQYRFRTEKGEIFGKFEEIVPGKKIVLSWLSGCDQKFDRATRVTLSFDDEEDGESSLELTHEFLPQDSVKSHREGWEFVAKELGALLK
jgi:uncharacterized protein YndB with AHSA1/START domain